MSVPFVLDARLAGDSVPVVELPLCSVRLMNDTRFPWLLLVPRHTGLVEVADLPETEQAALWREVGLAGRALRSSAPCEKLNIGALGNIVRQLHVHVIARQPGDAAWPGPVWGNGKASPYDEAFAQQRISALREAFAALAG